MPSIGMDPGQGLQDPDPDLACVTFLSEIREKDLGQKQVACRRIYYCEEI